MSDHSPRGPRGPRPLDFAPDDLDRPFWEACRRHEFLLQHCPASGRWHWPAVCDPEHGRALEWRRASGRGVVHTFTLLHGDRPRPYPLPAPYNVVVVELEEGPLFHSNLVGCPNEAIGVGMPVEVAFEDVSDEVTLPRFRPRREG